MGVKGLTTFINKRSEECMEYYELHDTKVVIDGDAVLCQLYYNHSNPRNGCFGGDYDKYGNTIYKFFHMLFQCKITPYIILDGGYESRKMDRILERFKQWIVDAQELNPRTDSRNQTSPIFIREAFEDIALRLNLKLIRCDFEGDRETANIAKALNCPVMSNDSDFYIFDVPYIPFSTFSMAIKSNSCTNKDTQEVVNYRYIPCKIYRIEKFLKCTGRMRKELLPLFAAMVGNDFMDGINVYKLGIQPKSNYYSHKIQAIIDWLATETKNSAVKKVLSIYKQEEQDIVNKKIEDAIVGYTFKNSKYLKYFDNSIVNFELEDDFEGDKFNVYEKLIDSFPTVFLEKFRKSLYPTRFMDILTQNKYYNFKPQIEVRECEHAHVVSYEIMSAIHKILTNSTQNLTCLIRDQSDVKEFTLPISDINLPNITEIQTMEINERQALILLILGIDEHFSTQCLNYFPDSWHLLILTLKYMRNKTDITWNVLYAIIVCKFTIDYIDTKIGFFRSEESFNNQYYRKIKDIMANKKPPPFKDSKSIKDALSGISLDDGVLFMNRLKVYFELNRNLKWDEKLYDRKLMHSLSQFQSCLLHMKNLNQLLNMPYTNFLITECFNGTFVYNFTYSLMKKENLDEHIKYLCQKAPSILNSFEMIFQLIRNIL